MLYFGRLRCCCWIDKRSSWNLSLWGLASQYHACILKGYFRMPTWASTLPKATSPSRQPLLTALLLWHLPMGCRQENDGGQCRSLWVLPGLPSWARGQKNRKGAYSHWTSAQTNLRLRYGLKTSFPFTSSVKTMYYDYSMCVWTFVFTCFVYKSFLKHRKMRKSLHSEDILSFSTSTTLVLSPNLIWWR